jgi:hypothetical protein
MLRFTALRAYDSGNHSSRSGSNPPGAGSPRRLGEHRRTRSGHADAERLSGLEGVADVEIVGERLGPVLGEGCIVAYQLT